MPIRPQGPQGQAPAGTDFLTLMGMALENARLAMYAGEVPVGAVIVASDGRILASQGNRVISSSDPTAHAEILAIREASRKAHNERLCGAIIIVTLEPCLMCAAAILEARLAGVVFGAADTQLGAVVSRHDYPSIARGRKVWHMGGVRASECASLLNNFFALKRNR